MVVMNVVVAVAVLQCPGRQFDPVWGDVMRAGRFIIGKEGYCSTILNENGLRAPSAGEARGYAERVLFVGDSFTAAFQVPDETTYVKQVESSLRASGANVLCVNAGQEGANSAAHLFRADAVVEEFRPTRVVLQVGDGDFSSELTVPVARGYWLEPNGDSWAPRQGSVDARADRLRDALTRVPLGYWLFQRWKASATPTPLAENTEADPEMIRWILQEYREKFGEDLLLVYTPEMDYFAGSSEPTEIEATVMDSCADLGIETVDLRDAFLGRYAESRQPLQGFANTRPGTGHWNAEGHAIVAQTVVARLLGSQPASR